MTTFEQQFDKAWRLITPIGKTTASALQRKMGIGFNRAAKIINEIEKRGIIGPLTKLTPLKATISL